MEPMPGRCFLCGQTLPKAAMAEHLQACRQPQPDGVPVFLFLVEDDYFPETYWLLLEARQDAPLSALDDFLRRVWVDCCGHYSQFVINGQVYGRRPNPSPVEIVLDEQANRLTMKSPLRDLVAVGKTMDYLYDEVWSSELHLKVLAAYAADPLEGAARVVARNYKPPRTCSVCDRPAAWLYTDKWPLRPYCDEHARQHPKWETDPDAFLPYVNSPRVGLCVYRGPAEEALKFEVYPPADHPIT